jgi:hypothetical protein
VDVRAPGWASKVGEREHERSVGERIAAAHVSLTRLTTSIAPLRTSGAIVSGRVTAEHERYFALKELAAQIDEELERIEEDHDARRHHYLKARQPEAVGRRPRYRAIKVKQLMWNHHDEQPNRSFISALNMEESIRELLETAEPADPAQDLFELENQLALLALMASAPASDQSTYLWIRGMPRSGSRNATDFVVNFARRGWEHGLGVEIKEIKPADLPVSDCLIEISGFHARQLALTEAGTHLVLPKHGGPMPIRVEVLDRWPANLADPFAFGPIVRVYPEGQPILDVRTGLLAAVPYAAEALRAMTLAALPRA